MAETSTTRDIVAKLWNLCHILRDDGVTYNEYVTELTFLLFLKMMAETGREEILPNGYRWSELIKRTGLEQLDYYKRLLLDLGTKGKATVAAIFVDAQTKLRKPTNLKALTDAIDKLDWFSAREEGLRQSLRRLAGKERRREEIGRRAIFYPATFDRQHRSAHAAAGRRGYPGPGGGHRRFHRRGRPLHQGHTAPTTSSNCPRSKSSFRSTMPYVGSGISAGRAPPLPDEPHAAWHRGRGRIRRKVLPNEPAGLPSGGGLVSRASQTNSADSASAC